MINIAIWIGVVTLIVLALFAVSEFHEKHKWHLLFGYILALTIPYTMLYLAYGYPRPIWMSNFDKAKITGIIFQEPIAIYLWLVPEGEEIPVAIKLPWDTGEANELQKLQMESYESGTGIGMNFDESNDENSPKFYEMPVQQLPLKDGLP